MKKKITLVVSLLLVMALSIGGTLAWLTDTDSVKNTFTIGNVDITLTETTGETYSFVPGRTMAKDPKITVTANSEKCYVFVEVKESDVAVKVTEGDTEVTKAFSDFITYAVDTADGWTALEGESGVFYRIVDKSASDTELYVLTDSLDDDKTGSITVKDTVTKEMVDALGATELALTFNAYAIQFEGTGSAAEAWEKF